MEEEEVGEFLVRIIIIYKQCPVIIIDNFNINNIRDA